MTEKLKPSRFTCNPDLSTILPGWKGTPLNAQGRFVNEEFPFVPQLRDVLKWQFSVNPQKKEKKADTFRLSHKEDLTFLQDTSDCLIWLGHASFFLRIGQVNFLIDPVFFNVPFVKRYTEHAFGPHVFNQVDYLLISHDHQDHCQEKSVRVVSQNNPKMKILTGLNMQDLLTPWLKGQQIQMGGWYQQYKTGERIEIFFMPTRHWSKRGLKDDNARLWGAFVIKAGQKVIYFGGDSGYGGHYKIAAKLFPSIQLAMIGCGAFKPEWFMGPNHSSPEDAVRAFQEIGAKEFFPMHYGTFDLSDEPVGEPYRRIKKLQEQDLLQGTLHLPALGEVIRF